MGNEQSGGHSGGGGGHGGSNISFNARASTPSTNTTPTNATAPAQRAWEFHQTGVFCTPEPNSVCKPVGYAGAGAGKNNPKAQSVPFVGPPPQGTYNIGPSFDSATKGPVTMKLEPIGGQEMYGRNQFMIHGDSKKDPGNASQGCIILPRPVREAIAKSDVKVLVVKSGEEEELKKKEQPGAK